MNTDEIILVQDIFKQYNLEWNNDDVDTDLLNTISINLG